MKPHKVYEVAMRRGDARQTDRELGSRSEGEYSRRWSRPAKTPDNLLSTGQLAPFVKAKAQLLAHDRVRPETADMIVFDLLADLAWQRHKRGTEPADSPEEVVSSVSEAIAGALRSLLVPNHSSEEQEVLLYQAGCKLVRALLFALREEQEARGIPLFKRAA